MPKKLDGLLVVRMHLLRQQGRTLDEIASTLQKEFENAPNRSTISRYVKRFQNERPEELADDVPFEWATMQNFPWESSRPLLDVWSTFLSAHVHLDEENRFTRRVAKWVSRVLAALTPEDLPSATNGTVGHPLF